MAVALEIENLLDDLFSLLGSESRVQFLLHGIVYGSLLHAHKGQNRSLVVASRCATSPVDVGGHVPGEIKVQDIVHALEVDATRRTRLEVSAARRFSLARGGGRFAARLLQVMLIRSDDDVVGALIELADSVDANVGWQFRVEDTGTDAKLFQE